MELHENNPKRNAEYYPGLTAYQAIRNVEPQRFPFMSVVYVCSPYAGDVEENIRKACAYCRYTVDQGCIPLAPHLYLPQFLDEESERELALFMDITIVPLRRTLGLWRCDFGGNGKRNPVRPKKRKTNSVY